MGEWSDAPPRVRVVGRRSGMRDAVGWGTGWVVGWTPLYISSNSAHNSHTAQQFRARHNCVLGVEVHKGKLTRRANAALKRGLNVRDRANP